MRTAFVTNAASHGVDPFAVETLAEILHDLGINCDVHAAYRVGDVDLVHQADAYDILQSLRQRMGPDRIPRTSSVPD